MFASGARLLFVVSGFAAVVQQVHEQGEVLEEKSALCLHQIAPIRFFRLEREPLEQSRHCVHAGFVQVSGQNRYISRTGRSDLRADSIKLLKIQPWWLGSLEHQIFSFSRLSFLCERWIKSRLCHCIYTDKFIGNDRSTAANLRRFSHTLGVPCINDKMSYNSLTTRCQSCDLNTKPFTN